MPGLLLGWAGGGYRRGCRLPVGEDAGVLG